jgi:hypothetical protein
VTPRVADVHEHPPELIFDLAVARPEPDEVLDQHVLVDTEVPSGASEPELVRDKPYLVQC